MSKNPKHPMLAIARMLSAIAPEEMRTAHHGVALFDPRIAWLEPKNADPMLNAEFVIEMNKRMRARGNGYVVFPVHLAETTELCLMMLDIFKLAMSGVLNDEVVASVLGCADRNVLDRIAEILMVQPCRIH